MDGPSYRALPVMRAERQGKQNEGELDLSYTNMIEGFEAPCEAIA